MDVQSPLQSNSENINASTLQLLEIRFQDRTSNSQANTDSLNGYFFPLGFHARSTRDKNGHPKNVHGFLPSGTFMIPSLLLCNYFFEP